MLAQSVPFHARPALVSILVLASARACVPASAQAQLAAWEVSALEPAAFPPSLPEAASASPYEAGETSQSPTIWLDAAPR